MQGIYRSSAASASEVLQIVTDCSLIKLVVEYKSNLSLILAFSD